ncbi:hypothetical protein NQ315_016708 [Exocentrus adspersus]|uniref:RNase H type-1 domain-containing protein n=1 Tax=Exocentrus adspersus TaxID=1586481 RepID=A0AAV8VET9_9CUCU|nr:hypothetical protein NQ315_016708 [Exocentrus adspersus]
MVIPKVLRHELDWWNINIGNGQNIKPELFSMEIFSDASPTRWGASSGGVRCHGFWDDGERQMHINLLEIKAAFYALSLSKDAEHTRILLRIDNQTAISCINRGGSIKYSFLNEAATELWRWCENKKISIFAAYIPSSQNIEADRESRSDSFDTEYQLNNTVFGKILQEFGTPEIYLFASRIKTKCETYVSWFPDPGSLSVDAFTLNWTQYFFYAFPPFAIIARVLEKIIQEKAQGIVVVPLWPTQPWYPETPSASQKPCPGGREIIRRAFLKRGTPENAVSIMMASITEGPLKQYSASLKKYWDFCQNKQVDALQYNLNIYLNFLLGILDSGSSFSILNLYRSELNLILNPISVANIRPPTPKYRVTWNPDSLLEFLGKWYPLETLDLEKLTYKLVTLMALTSTSRVQTLSVIKLTNISKSGNTLQIKIPDRIKTSALGKPQPVLIFNNNNNNNNNAFIFRSKKIGKRYALRQPFNCIFVKLLRCVALNRTSY